MYILVLCAGVLLGTVDAAPQLYTAAIAPGLQTTQYHAQDGLGQYAYGYAGGPSAKSEVKTADGITRGSFSYVDANGILQTANYVSDPVNGFRVSRTDDPVGHQAVAVVPAAVAAPAVLASAHSPTVVAVGPAGPVDTPEVAAAKAQHFAAHAEASARNAKAVLV